MNPAESAAIGSHGDQNSQSGAQDNNYNNSNQRQTDQTGAEADNNSNVGDSTGFEVIDGGGGFDNF